MSVLFIMHCSQEDINCMCSLYRVNYYTASYWLVVCVFQAELLDKLRRRRGQGDCTSDDDEDLGLPHSPCNSPTTADVLLEQGLKVGLQCNESCLCL